MRQHPDKERMDWLESVRPGLNYPNEQVELYRNGLQKLDVIAPTWREAIDKVKGNPMPTPKSKLDWDCIIFAAVCGGAFAASCIGAIWALMHCK